MDIVKILEAAPYDEEIQSALIKTNERERKQ